MWNSRDVVIIGGGVAGLSAALILGRCRRSVVVVDAGKPRNSRSRSLNGFITRDGIPPQEFLEIAREQLQKYDTVEIKAGRVESAVPIDGRFRVTTDDESEFDCLRILLATGMADELPDIPGAEECYGTTVHHCPYCDGWEWRDRKIAALGHGAAGEGLAGTLLRWSGDVILCTNGASHVAPEQLEALAERGIAIVETRIARLRHTGGALEAVEFEDGSSVPREALFFAGARFQRSRLAETLGCRFDEKGFVSATQRELTSVPGVYVAGDACGDLQMAVIAAADGASAAFAINKELSKAELAAGISVPI